MNDWVPIIVETILLVPFFGWGVYSVYMRFHRRAESTILSDGVTTLVLVVFLAFQIHYLGAWGQRYPVEYVFSVLGLLAAAAALYGHVAYTLATQILMELAHPTRDDSSIDPRWGAAEARERVDDLPGALAEYFKLLRKHPRHVLLNVRVAETLVQLDRSIEAPPYLRMALDSATSPDRQLAVVNRLCDLYVGVLGEPEQAERCLDAFIESNPRGTQSEAARRRRERLELDLEAPPVPPLDTLDAHPVEDAPDDELRVAGDGASVEPLESLEEHPLYWSDPPEALIADFVGTESSPAAPISESTGLAALDADPLDDAAELEEPLSSPHGSDNADQAPGESSIERM